jgi:hypothetical protein
MTNPPVRVAVERCVEALIELLDVLDGDPDLEGEEADPDGDEQDFDKVHWL